MNKAKNFYIKYLHNSVALCAFLAVTINVVIETFARPGVLGGIKFLFESPMVFLVNTLIIFATLSIAVLFRRRIFVIAVVSMAWLAIGVTNGIILSQRMTPFTTDDVLALKEGFEMAVNYLSFQQLAIYCIGAVAIAGGLILLFIKAPKKAGKVEYRKAVGTIIIAGLLVFGALTAGTKTGVMDTYFPNLAYGYRDNGVPYCFLNTWLNKGVGKPKNYSEEKIKGIFTAEELAKGIYQGEGNATTEASDPNIIFVQLESVVDPYDIKDLTFSKDPIPVFRELMSKYPSGKLTVPTMGAGTANTEFEMMTGFRAKLFGPGEYPYKTVMKESTAESYAYDLKDLGYATHAIHNHRGVFYGRNTVFANLGFDTFTSLEYMQNAVKTQKNWAKDGILTDAIVDALNTSEEKDYIFTISVQGHGRYPVEEVIKKPEVTVETTLSEELKWQYEYYANQIYETDRFVGELTATLESYGEDTMVVFYGDHLPAIENIVDENLIERTTYETDYVIWANFDIENKDEDLFAYELGAKALGMVGINQGTMLAYHQKHSKDKDYQTNLQALQYDMLYGKKYIYGGQNPFVKTNLKMGVNKIKVESVVQIGEKYYIKGQNFTEFSKINLDGKILKTIYLGPNLLGLLEEVDPESASQMKISQVEKGQEILSTTE